MEAYDMIEAFRKELQKPWKPKPDIQIVSPQWFEYFKWFFSTEAERRLKVLDSLQKIEWWKVGDTKTPTD